MVLYYFIEEREEQAKLEEVRGKIEDGNLRVMSYG